MYKTNKPQNTTIKVVITKEGESIEEKVMRITTEKTPIKDGAPLMYTDRKDGVLAGSDIRTDRFDVAIDAMHKVAEASPYLRKGVVIPIDEKKDIGKPESTDGTKTE